MRIQFTVDVDEWNKLQIFAKDEGYPDVSSYCRDVSLKERTYAKMWATIEERIAKMKSGTQFSLNDIINVPPANLGVKLYNNQTELGIEKLGKTNGSNKFKRL